MIRDRMRSTNGVLAYELRKYAELSGIREMLRFAAIVNDNIDKGSTLAEKLEAESSLLWYNRKKKAEELGRLADTKLVLPLLILLLLLIMITIAPALMAM
jgi:tight adherence protein C